MRLERHSNSLTNFHEHLPSALLATKQCSSLNPVTSHFLHTVNKATSTIPHPFNSSPEFGTQHYLPTGVPTPVPSHFSENSGAAISSGYQGQGVIGNNDYQGSNFRPFVHTHT